MITRERYVELFEQGQLKKNVICRDLIEVKVSKPTVFKDFEAMTPNPDPEEMLKKFKEEEPIDANNNAPIHTNANDNNSSHKKHVIDNHWNEMMEVEEEKNNIKSLCVNVFRMKTFLDEKFEIQIKGFN